MSDNRRVDFLTHNVYVYFVYFAFFWFLADRTNGRAIATLLRLSSVCLSVVCDVMYCG